MSGLSEALAGFALCAGVGALLRRLRPETFDATHAPAMVATLITDVTFPALSIAVLARGALPSGVLWVLAPSLGAAAASLAMAWMLSRAFGLGSAQAGAVILCVGFGNTAFVGLPMTQALFGDPASLTAALLVDTVATTLGLWTVGVAIATRFGGSTGGPGLLRALSRPATLSVLLGLILGALEIKLPRVVSTALELLGGMTTPLAFLFLGLRLDPRGVWEVRGPLALVGVLKLALSPLVAWFVVRSLDLRGPSAAVGTLQSAMPTAIVAAVIAERAGCDARIAAGAVAVTVPIGVALVALTGPWVQSLAR